MLFHTLRFAGFFVLFYAMYRLIPEGRLRLRNLLLLAASYLFYGFWDMRFLALLWVLTAVNYWAGLAIEAAPASRRKTPLVSAIAIDLGILACFKYFGFFTGAAAALLGVSADALTIKLILPLGISFYTFQAMSYPLDVYRGRMKATRDPADFALFVAFFPTLVSGPIERARELIPQIQSPRPVSRSDFASGVWLCFLGLFKKILIADNLAKVTSVVFAAPSNMSGFQLLLGTYAFAWQIYADFSGYSDAARGLGKMMGFNLTQNFRQPFFSKDLFELWQKWHVSLTTWIKEYLFYPLALASWRGKSLSPSAVILVTWVLMGLWHGPAWRFAVWGVYHGVLLVAYNALRPALRRIRPSSGVAERLWSAAACIVTFHLFAAGLLFFAMPSVSAAAAVFARFFSGFDAALTVNFPLFGFLFVLTIPLLIVEYGQFTGHDECPVFSWHPALRGTFYYACFYLTVLYGVFSARQYYYFQF